MTHVCRINHIGTASNMGPEGAKRIWERSGKTNCVTLSSMGMEIAKVFLAVKETYKR